MNYNELTFVAKEKKITMTQLAKDVGMTLMGLKASIDRKTIPWIKIDLLCKILEITPHELMDWHVATVGNYANHIQGNNNQNSNEALQIISKQLDKKDREIDRLLKIIEKLKKS